MSTWLVAIVGGVAGSMLTAVLAFGGKFLAARRAIEATDRFVHDRDEDLASWVSDRTLALEREIAEATERLNARKLFHSGTHGNAIARLKERALHEYRDQERQAQRDVAVARERETWAHSYWRGRDRHPFPTLTTPDRGRGILDVWRSSVTRHGGPPVEVHDSTQRGLHESAQTASINKYT